MSSRTSSHFQRRFLTVLVDGECIEQRLPHVDVVPAPGGLTVAPHEAHGITRDFGASVMQTWMFVTPPGRLASRFGASWRRRLESAINHWHDWLEKHYPPASDADAAREVALDALVIPHGPRPAPPPGPPPPGYVTRPTTTIEIRESPAGGGEPAKHGYNEGL